MADTHKEGGFEPIGLLARPGIAAANLYRMDPQAALLSLIAPDKLTPKERRSFSAEFLKDADKSPVLKTLIDVATNPLVLIGLVAAVKYPPIHPKLFQSIATKFGAYGKVMNPITSWISSPHITFAGTPIARYMERIVIATDKFKHNWLKQFGGANATLFKELGRPLTRLEQAQIGARLDGLDKATGALAKQYKMPRPLLKPMKLHPAIERTVSAYERGFSDMANAYDALDDVTKAGLDSKMAAAHGVKRAERIEGFFPHVLSKEPLSVQAALRTQIGMTTNIPQRMRLEGLAQSIDKVTSMHWSVRRGRMIPSRLDLELFRNANLVDNEMEALLYDKLKVQADYGRELLRDLASKYTPDGVLESLTGKAKGNALKTNDKIINQMKRVLVGKDLPSRMKADIAQLKAAARKAGEPLDPTKLRILVDQYDEHFFIEGPAAGMEKLGGFSWTEKTADTALSFALDKMKKGDIRAAHGLLDSTISDTANALPYTLDYVNATSHYVHATAHEWGFSVAGPKTGGKSWGALLRDESDKLKIAGETMGNQAAKQRYEFLTQDWEPKLRGIPDTDVTSQRAWWKDMKIRALDWVDKPYVREIMGDSGQQWLKKKVVASIAASGGETNVAGYFYLTTLGINPSPAIKNLLQVPITTGALLGPGSQAAGYKRLAPKVNEYINLRSKGMGDEEAMGIAFKEYLEQGMPLDPITRLAAPDHLATGGGLDALKKKMMLMFTMSERHNRLLTYEMGVAHGLKNGMGEEAAKEFAASLIGPTQFFGGPSGAPRGLLKMAPWARQFMQFPLRYLEFLRLSTIWGSGATGARNWGTIGRVAVVSAGLNAAVRNVAGIDLSPGLLSGALPLPSFEGSPFYPFPFVPPAISVAGSAVMGLHQGDVSKLGQAGALMIPGGIAGRRVYKAFAPKYADYANETPDGRVPTYTDKGMLVGYRTKKEMVLSGLGFSTMDKKNEQELTNYLLKQRDQIREYRRNYLTAIMENDYEKATKINDEFKRRYPELGDIRLKKGDYTAMETRRTHSRLSRVLRGFPKEYRGQFEQVAATTLAPGFFGPSGVSPTMGQHYLEMGQQ